MPKIPSPPSGVQSLERAFELLRQIAEHQNAGVSLAELCALTRIDRTTAFRMLRFLEHGGYVERGTGEHRRYRLGCASFGLGLAAFVHSPLIGALTPLMKSLARQSQDNVFLVIRLGDLGLTLHLEQGSVPIPRYAELVGATRLLGLGTGSTALLASLPDSEIQAHLGRHGRAYAETALSPMRVQRAVQRTLTLGYTLAAQPGVAGAGYAFVVPGAGTVALSILSSHARMPVARRHALARLMIDEVAGAGYAGAGDHPQAQRATLADNSAPDSPVIPARHATATRRPPGH